MMMLIKLWPCGDNNAEWYYCNIYSSIKLFSKQVKAFYDTIPFFTQTSNKNSTFLHSALMKLSQRRLDPLQVVVSLELVNWERNQAMEKRHHLPSPLQRHPQVHHSQLYVLRHYPLLRKSLLDKSCNWCMEQRIWKINRWKKRISIQCPILRELGTHWLLKTAWLLQREFPNMELRLHTRRN